MPRRKYLLLVWLVVLLKLGPACRAQQKRSINWITFEQLSDSLTIHPKPVFITFYTSWCVYCRKMEQEVFTSPEIADLINARYYAVRMDAEHKPPIIFDGQTFKNYGDKKSGSFHELALLLASHNGSFAPPAHLLLDKNFKVLRRSFSYLDRRTLTSFLNLK